MKNANAGLLGFLLALGALATPRVDAASAPATGTGTIDARLSRLTDAVRGNDPMQTSPTNDPIYLGYTFLNSAPSFRNAVGGWLNRVPGWINHGVWRNSGVSFLNNVPAFRNYYNGWPNHVSGWRNGGGAGWGNGGGFRNSTGGFRNGAFGNGGGFRNGAFRNS